jgi:hypothetical protein
MSEGARKSTSKTCAGLVAAATVASTFASATLGAAPAANATCASFFGIGNSADRRSNLTSVAIAIGNSTALADGMFGSAIAIGNSDVVQTLPGAAFTFAQALGNFGSATAGGNLALAASVGNRSNSYAGTDSAPKIANIALNIANHSGTGSSAVAEGLFTTSVNIGGDQAVVDAVGFFNTAVNLLGSNTVMGGPTNDAMFSLAFSIFGDGNTVAANGFTPLAIAGSIFQTGAHIVKA